MLCISGLNYFNHKKHYLFPFLRFFGHENFAFLRSLYLWANYECSIFRPCATFFDIHYVHSDIGISLMLGTQRVERYS